MQLTMTKVFDWYIYRIYIINLLTGDRFPTDVLPTALVAIYIYIYIYIYVADLGCGWSGDK